MLNTQEVEMTVAQFAAKPGFIVSPNRYNHKFTVKYRRPHTPGSLIPTKSAFRTVAEVEVKLEGGGYTVYVEQRVFGNDRPKIDRLMASLEAMPIEGISIIKIR